ncbi:MAG: hypothetical protein AAF676_10620 [Pseudomonadota bacterium]
MSVETVEAFAERATACVTELDRQAYKELFDLPCAVWGDDGCDLRLTEARLDEVFDRIERNLDALGRPRHRLRIDAERLLGERLTALRVLTWLELDGAGSRTDPTSELWILREREGRLRLTGLVNPMSVHVLGEEGEPEPDHGPRSADGEAEAGGPATVNAFLAALHDMIRDADVEANLRLIGLPYLRFTDELTGMVSTPQERRAMAEAAHRVLGPRAAATARTTVLAERPYGQTLTCLGIRFDGVLAEGDRLDPREELWILRDAGRGLQLCGVVNPVTHELMRTEDHFETGEPL